MLKAFSIILLASALVDAQTPAPSKPANSPAQNTNDNLRELFPEKGDKIGLVRGVLKKIDPIFDQFVIQTFGGPELRIKFDGRTELIAPTTHTKLMNLPAGSVLSIDTVTTQDGNLFARSVRTGKTNFAELNGQVVLYDAARSQLTLRDPVSPEDVSLRITPQTTVVRQGKITSAQTLSAGMLVSAWASPVQNTVERIEILAKPGDSFTFAGKVIAVNLRTHLLSLLNDSDQSLHELYLGALDAGNLALLREGNSVSIAAEFDGNHYNVRSIAAMPQHQ